MKLTTIFLIASMLQVSAASMAQQVTFKKNDVTLKALFKEVRKQTGYSVVWESEKFNANEKVDVNFERSSLQEVFNKVVSGKGYSYLIDEKTIIIENRKDKVNVEAVKLATIDVTGKVVDEQGRPMSGVNVRINDSNRGTSTKSDGTFKITNVDENATLILSFMGYGLKEVKAQKEMGTIILSLSNNKLDEVQIQAYGITSRRLSTSNIATVKADEIAKQPINNPLLALQGRVSGMQITQETGYAGGAITVRIQGQNSFMAGREPFYVVDGVPFASSMPNTGLGAAILQRGQSNSGYNGANGVGSPFSYLNPSDIESIDILKDADATAIYGSRAANGAIIITTKKGKAGQMDINLNLQSGVGKVAKRMELLNIDQYLEMRREALKNEGVQNISTLYDVNGTWDLTRNVDWQEELIGGTAQYHDGQLSISGGNQNVQYRLGANYHRETTVLPLDFAYGRSSVNFSLNSASANQKLKIGLQASYSDNTNKLPSTDLTAISLQIAPNSPPLWNADGSINWDLDANGVSRIPSFVSSIALLERKLKLRTTNLIANFNISYALSNNLNFKALIGYVNTQGDDFTSYPSTSLAPAERSSNAVYSQFSNNNSNSLTIEPQLNYSKTFGSHRISALIGLSLQQQNQKGIGYFASGYSNDALLESPQFATSLSSSMDDSKYKYGAGFAELNYNYKDTYILKFSGRRDGSSRFGPNNRFHNFASLGAAWVFSNQKEFNLPQFISFGKVKASVGTTGSDQIGNYTYLDLYNLYSVGIPYQSRLSYAPSRLYNPNLQWEETKKINIGLDAGFFKDRIYLSANYGRNVSSNQLGPLALPLYVGLQGSVTENLDIKILNTSWEFIMSSQNLKMKEFAWSTDFNMTIPKNKLVSLDSRNPNLAQSYYVGYPLNTKKYYNYLGVDPGSGDYLFTDLNGNPTRKPSILDQTQFLSRDPKYYLGLTNNFVYKSFSLSFNLRFQKQLNENYLLNSAAGPGFQFTNQPISVLNRWQKPGDLAETASFITNPFGGFSAQSRNIINSSTAVVADGSFLRLTNASLSWDFTKKIADKLSIKHGKISLQGQNLFTVTRYQGMDPESGQAKLPPLRTITLGAQVTF